MRVTLSAVAATEPNSKTVTLAARGTSTAPFMPGTSEAVVADMALDGLSSGWGFGEPLNQERRPMPESESESV